MKQVGGAGASPWKLLKGMQKSLNSVITMACQASARAGQRDMLE